jgi:exonuclease III
VVREEQSQPNPNGGQKLRQTQIKLQWMKRVRLRHRQAENKESHLFLIGGQI